MKKKIKRVIEEDPGAYTQFDTFFKELWDDIRIALFEDLWFENTILKIVANNEILSGDYSTKYRYVDK